MLIWPIFPNFQLKKKKNDRMTNLLHYTTFFLCLKFQILHEMTKYPFLSLIRSCIMEQDVNISLLKKIIFLFEDSLVQKCKTNAAILHLQMRS